MEIKVTLQPNETPEQAEELFVKAITEKYSVEKEPHPDPVVNELVYKFVQEYNKQLVGMIDEIFQVIKSGKEVVGKSWEFQKGKALPEGTVRVWDGYEYVKQGKEWKPTGKKKSSEPEVEKKEKTTETKETPKEKDTEQGIHSFDKKIWYHSTPSENVESIKKEGFRPSQNSMFGSGVYLAESPAYSDSKMTHLPIQARVTKTLEVRSIDFPEQYQKITGKKYSGVGGMEKDLQEHGYDSVYITDDKWLLVFDPKNLEVIDRPPAPSVDVDPQQVEKEIEEEAKKDTEEIITDEEKEKLEIPDYGKLSIDDLVDQYLKPGPFKQKQDVHKSLATKLKEKSGRPVSMSYGFVEGLSMIKKAGTTLDSHEDEFYEKISTLESNSEFRKAALARLNYMFGIKATGQWSIKNYEVLKNFEIVARKLPIGHVARNKFISKFENHSMKTNDRYAFYWQDKKVISLSDKCYSHAKMKGDLSSLWEFENVVAHEIGHAVSKKVREKLGEDKILELAEISGFLKQENEAFTSWSFPKGYITDKTMSEYARTNPEENFAEVYSVYLMNQEHIEKIFEQIKPEMTYVQKHRIISENPIQSRERTMYGVNRVLDKFLPQFEWMKKNVFDHEKIKKSKEQDLDPTEEQIEEFKKRTKEHIDRVRKNLNYLGTVTDLDKKKLDEIGKNHDHTKFEPDMIKPYSFINEYYKQLRQGKKVERPKVVDSATEYHVTTETHHPEAHKDINKMSDYDLAEMVSDWQAMSQELGEGSCRGWADKHVGTRWKFNDEVKKKIYQFIEKFEEKK